MNSTRSNHTPAAVSISLPLSHSRRPSISSTMHWLSRSSTQSSSTTPYAPSKPVRISEPKLSRSIELISARSGVLGSGATVVRTPDEALRETGVRLTYDGKTDRTNQQQVQALASKSVDKLSLPPPIEDLPSPPESPPLPPLPLPLEREEHDLGEDEQFNLHPPVPSRAPPAVPTLNSTSSTPSLRPSLKVRSTNSQEYPPPIPSASLPTPTPPPEFKPILVSPIPSGTIDPAKIVVTLETCTATYRTTLDTLRSRPSLLADYVNVLVSRTRSDSHASSVYSNASEDMSAYRNHLISQGLISPSNGLHIFLDRPSAPYAHILTYLRTPTPSETLPRAALIHTLPTSSSSSALQTRLEALLDLRDEAAYLHLDALQKLCSDELQLRPARVAAAASLAKGMHARSHSSGTMVSVSSTAAVHSHQPVVHNNQAQATTSGLGVGGSHQSLRASVYSLHALMEKIGQDQEGDDVQSQLQQLRHSTDEDEDHERDRDHDDEEDEEDEDYQYPSTNSTFAVSALLRERSRGRGRGRAATDAVLPLPTKRSESTRSGGKGSSSHSHSSSTSSSLLTHQQHPSSSSSASYNPTTAAAAGGAATSGSRAPPTPQSFNGGLSPALRARSLKRQTPPPPVSGPAPNSALPPAPSAAAASSNGQLKKSSSSRKQQQQSPPLGWI